MTLETWTSERKGVNADVKVPNEIKRLSKGSRSMYTRCFFRKVELSSCTLAARPLCTFLAASNSWWSLFDGGNEWPCSMSTRWMRAWHFLKSFKVDYINTWSSSGSWSFTLVISAVAASMSRSSTDRSAKPGRARLAYNLSSLDTGNVVEECWGVAWHDRTYV